MAEYLRATINPRFLDTARLVGDRQLDEVQVVVDDSVILWVSVSDLARLLFRDAGACPAGGPHSRVEAGTCTKCGEEGEALR